MPAAANLIHGSGSISLQPINVMKKLHFVLGLSAALLGACSKEQTERAREDATTAAEKTKEAASTFAAKTAEAAVKTKDAVARKMDEWKLSPDDIRDDFQKTGRIVRSKSVGLGQRVGEAVDDARVVTAIKAKYLTDHDLSAFGISVSSEKGLVTLNGSVKSLDLAGRATALALDTDGVTSVVSLLRIAP
jgi:hypothetical protein